jgi:hypothetical protein
MLRLFVAALVVGLAWVFSTPAAMRASGERITLAENTPPASLPVDTRATRVVGVPVATPPPKRAVQSSHEPCVVEGIVRDVAGAPTEAMVYVMPSGGGPRRAAVHADKGRFSIELPPGDYAMFADGTTGASTSLDPISLAPSETIRELELMLGGQVLSGTVLGRDGQPARAWVEVLLPGRDAALTQARTKGDTGAFTADGVPDQPIVLWVQGEDGASIVRKLPRPRNDLVLRLEDPAGITLQVLDQAGQPSPSASVSLTDDHNHQWATLSTDERGAVRLTPLPCFYATAHGQDNTASEPTRIDFDERPQTVTLTLRPAASVHGRIVDAEGHAASGWAELRWLDGPAHTAFETITTLDDDGGYQFVGLLAGRYVVTYSPGEEQSSTDAEIDFQIGETESRALADLRIDRERALTGVVLDHNGEPVQDADVELIERLERSSFGSLIRTDSEGRFSTRVRGPVRLRAAGPEGAISDILAASAQGDEQVTLALQSTGLVEGALRGATGDARVRCVGGLWHDVEAEHYSLSCPIGAALEVEVDGRTQTYSLETSEDESTYGELRW